MRTLVDLGAVAPDLVAPTLTDFVVDGLVTVEAMWAALERHRPGGRAGLGPLRCALEGWPLDGTRPDSGLEVEFARLLRDNGIVGFEFQQRIGPFRVDAVHRRRRLIVETDGWEHHGTRPAFEADRLRDATLLAEGWRVMRITWQQQMTDPSGVVDRIRRSLAAVRPTRHRARPSG